MTPEKIKKVNDNWEHLSRLLFNSIGEVVTEEDYEQDKHQQKQKQIEAHHKKEEQDNIESWQRIDFETLNSLIIKYKQTGDQLYFNRAWNRYLNRLTQNYMNQFVIKGLTVSAKRLFLAEHHYDQLQDVLYEVLIKAIEKWTPYMTDQNTRDFAAYYKQAVEFYTGNIINRCKRLKHQQISIQHIDFTDEKEVNMLLVNEPRVATQFEYYSNLESVVLNDYVDTFIRKHLTNEQAMIVNLMMTKHSPKSEIAKYLKVSRMTLHRKWKEIQALWLEYAKE